MARRRETTRQALLDAASEVIHDQGVQAATTKEIARRAGVSEAAIYVHFPNKQTLLASLIRERLHLPVIALDIDDGDGRPIRDTLARMVRAALRSVDNDLPLVTAVFSDAELAEMVSAEPPGDGKLEGLGRLEAFLARQQERGRIGRDCPPLVLARLLLGAAFHQAFIARMFGERSLRPRGRAFVDTMVDGVLAAAGEPDI